MEERLTCVDDIDGVILKGEARCNVSGSKSKVGIFRPWRKRASLFEDCFSRVDADDFALRDT